MMSKHIKSVSHSMCGDKKEMDVNVNLNFRLLSLFSIFFVFTLLFLPGAEGITLKINSNLNELQSTFNAVENSISTANYDGYDLVSPTAPSNYSRFYSRICSSGSTCLLAFDSWNGTLPRVINLTYQVTPSQNGTLALDWSFSDADYNVTLDDYGSDSTYTTKIASTDLNEDSSYSTSVQSTTFRYFQLTVEDAPAGGTTGDTTGGATTTTGGGGGGGGGGGTGLTGASLSNLPFLEGPSGLSYTSVIESQTRRSFEITNILNIPITLEIVIDGFGGIVSAEESQITLQPGETRDITLFLGGTDKGLVTGTIQFYYGNNPFIIPIVLNVRTENFLFDATISVADTQRNILPGETLNAQVSLLQVGPQEKVDVTASYVIKDFSGHIFLEDTETFFVLGSKDLTKDFPTDNLPPGKYILGMEIFYPGAFATSSLQFTVVEKQPIFTRLNILLALTVLIGLAVIIVIYRNLNNKPSVSVKR